MPRRLAALLGVYSSFGTLLGRGAGVAMLVILAVIWLLVGFFRALGTLIGQELAYAVVGGILLLAGVFVWVKRHPDEETSPTQE